MAHLERLKADLATRHIPICVVSTDDSRQRALNSGAIGFLTKPLQSVDVVNEALAHLYQFADRSAKKLLVLMPDSAMRSRYLECLDSETNIVMADSVEAARAVLSGGGVDCLVTDGSVADFGPEDVIETLEQRPSAGTFSCCMVVSRRPRLRMLGRSRVATAKIRSAYSRDTITESDSAGGVSMIT